METIDLRFHPEGGFTFIREPGVEFWIKPGWTMVFRLYGQTEWHPIPPQVQPTIQELFEIVTDFFLRQMVAAE